jgi:hypothetical protein
VRKWLWIVLGALVAVVVVIASIGALLPENHTVTRSSRFHQTPQRIWDVIAGPPTWRPGVKSFQNLPPRNGHRTWRETDTHGNAVTYEALQETAPVRLVTRIADPNLPYGGIWVHEITVDQGSSVLQITEDGQVHNPIFRFMSRFVFGYTATIDDFLKALHAKLGDRET